MNENKKVAFVSHAGADKERFVRPFAAAVRERGVDAWVDEWEIKAGDSFAEKIYEAIDDASAVVVVLSENSVDSPWVKDEINAALVRRIRKSARMIPVILDGLPEKRIPSSFHHMHQVRRGDSEHDAAADEVCRAIFELDHPGKPPLGSTVAFINRVIRSEQPTSSLSEIRLRASGDAAAQNELGRIYVRGEIIPQDDLEAMKWFRRAAEQEYAPAQFNLGLSYHIGRGVPQNDSEAAKWWLRAAEQGVAEAQCNLGVMYDHGKGIPQDRSEAVRWYRRAAEQGGAQAQYNLGVMYAKGEGIPQNDSEAVQWFRLAAEQEFAEAQYNLGVMYATGEGVPQDSSKAVKWCRRAAEQGLIQAKDALEHLRKKKDGKNKDGKS